MLYDPKAFFTHAALLRQTFVHCARFPTAASRRSLGRVSVPVWLIVLSDQLPILALVSRYLTNELMGREPISERPKALTAEPNPWSHAVLATLSGSYPPLGGTSLTCYSPVRHFTQGPKAPFSCDLHVLGTPPAFVLSQDQTLQFEEFPSLSISGSHRRTCMSLLESHRRKEGSSKYSWGSSGTRSRRTGRDFAVTSTGPSRTRTARPDQTSVRWLCLAS